jgi:hypothetical protein
MRTSQPLAHTVMPDLLTLFPELLGGKQSASASDALLGNGTAA